MVKLTLNYFQTNKIKALKSIFHVNTKNVLYGIKDSSRYCLFHSQIMEAGVEYFRVKWTNKVYSMPLFLTMSHCCEMDWDLFFSQMDSGLISHHWSSRVQITFVGKIKIVSWIILKCINPLSWYIASVRLESFIRSKRELQHFSRRKGQLSVDHISLSFLYSALLHCVISSNCFLCFRTKTVIMTWWVLFSDCACLRLAGAGALTFVFSKAQTWPGNSCVTSL